MLSEDGSAFERVEIVRTKKAPVDKMLRDLATDAPVTIPGWMPAAAGVPAAHITVGKRVTVLTARVTALSLSTVYTISGSATPRRGVVTPPVAIPSFITGQSAVRMKPRWTPPDDMHLWFNVHTRAERPNQTPVLVYCSLCATCNSGNSGTKGLYLLPLPNTYGDGRVCMGGTTTAENPGTAVTVYDMFVRAWKQFDANMWNGDLLAEANLPKIEGMFRFDPNDSKQLPPTIDWTTVCTKFGNSELDAVPFATLA